MLNPTHFNAQLLAAARDQNFAVEELTSHSGYAIYALTRKAAPSGDKPPLRLYLSSGIHGDEPAGPLALLELLESGLLPRDTDIAIVPLINPTGIKAKKRENDNGWDLNRDFRYPKNPETQAVREFIISQAPFHLSVALHEDWESSGFYMYCITPDGDDRLPRKILNEVKKEGPLEPETEIDGHPAENGLITRPADFDLEGRDDWPEAFLLYERSEHVHITTESASSAQLRIRIAQQCQAVKTAIRLLEEKRKNSPSE
ncbi:M14 family metallopeptidase [Pelagicoccus albus]|uniref:M14 family metallocarboxypeptidase n=1 Tax=Pelagicoccus albus TaxID=415222 RepID=A0A7X1E9T2_9BACT|nr:M14 family metallocarboxypeptidase [Pelagicoccus albus]MBC2607686.1 M14 family metallocarboxypeptidase [Pelagicoccus albus]